MKQTWTLMIGLLLLSAAVCSGEILQTQGEPICYADPGWDLGPICADPGFVPQDQGPAVGIGQLAQTNVGYCPSNAADALYIISGSLSESTGSLIPTSANWDSTPEPAQVQLNVGVDPAAQSIACRDAVRNSAQQLRDLAPQLCGEAPSVPPILNIFLQPVFVESVIVIRP